MRAQIQNIRGLESADLDVSKIALVAGLNHAGKTSALLPVSCALAGITAPLGLRKTDGGMLVRIGAGKGLVTVSTDGGEVSIEWPKGDRITKGETPPTASLVAVGLENVAEMPAIDRGKLLNELLDITPTREDFDAACRAVGLMGATDKVWDTIERDGWDATHKKAGDKGREQKGAWTQVTKEAYGAKKAETWMPNGWDDGLSSKSKDTLEAELSAVRSELEFAIGELAIGEDEFRRLTEAADGLDAARTARDAAQEVVTAKQAEAETARKAREACPEATETGGHACPECGTMLELAAGPGGAGRALAKVAKLSDAELESRRMAIASADGKLNKARSELAAARATLATAESAVLAAEKAKRTLDEGVKTTGSTAAEVDAKREAVRRAENSLKAFEQKTEADRIHGAIQRNELLIGVLADTGVRREVLIRKLAEFNATLARMCADAKWGAVSVSDALTVEYIGRPYVLLSKSEQFRAAVTLQVAIAGLDGSDAVVIDGADILDNPGRASLMRLLGAWGKPALVGMTMPRVEAVPDLAAQGIGVSYWAESGKINAIGGK